ncbi:S-4TM family putative pore-forming effector [Pseudomonas benzopyrenica]|uniref:S-4TM family putative pore-forming effector n=1 Tax=Pseudomonas benzopyrenica TaxID=2993566 RepID=UPI0039C2CDD2
MDNNVSIQEKQNHPEIILRLAAQRRLYDIAKKLSNGLFMFSVVSTTILTSLSLVLNSEVLSLYYGYPQKDYSSYLAIYAFLVIIAEKFIISNQVDSWKELAAKIQEQLDRRIYNLQWNAVVSGKEPREECIIKHGEWYLHKFSQEKLVDWYPLRNSKAQHLLQIVICQNANLSWDLNLRRRISQIIVWAGFILFSVTLVVAVILDVPAFSLTINLLSLLAPICSYGFAAHKENKEFIEQSEHLLGCVDEAIDSACAGIDSTALLKRVENIQEQIYLKRKKSWLIPSFFYWIVRDRDERVMIQSAEALENKFRNVKQL